MHLHNYAVYQFEGEGGGRGIRGYEQIFEGD